MRKILDTNMWIALTLEEHPQHAAARHWYEETPLTAGDLLFCRQTELSFLRLITQERAMVPCGINPLTNEEAATFLANVCRDSAVTLCAEPPGTRSLWLEMARTPWPSPNVWMDAYLAALTITLGAEMVTFDTGFHGYTERGLQLALLTP